MRSLSALALGLLFVGFGLYGAAAAAPLVFPAAFDADGRTTSAVALFVMLSITEVFTLFGGWVTARLVTDHRAGHAILMATIGLAVAVAVGAVRWDTAPSWYHVTAWVLMPAAAAIGAAAWERSLRRKSGDLAQRVITT